MKVGYILTLFAFMGTTVYGSDLSVADLLRYVPSGYTLENVSRGDLNRDGKVDYSLMIVQYDTNLVFYSIGGDTIDGNRGGLVILVSDGDNYKTVVEKYSCLSPQMLPTQRFKGDTLVISYFDAIGTAETISGPQEKTVGLAYYCTYADNDIVISSVALNSVDLFSVEKVKEIKKMRDYDYYLEEDEGEGSEETPDDELLAFILIDKFQPESIQRAIYLLEEPDARHDGPRKFVWIGDQKHESPDYELRLSKIQSLFGHATSLFSSNYVDELSGMLTKSNYQCDGCSFNSSVDDGLINKYDTMYCTVHNYDGSIPDEVVTEIDREKILSIADGNSALLINATEKDRGMNEDDRIYDEKYIVNQHLVPIPKGKNIYKYLKEEIIPNYRK